MLLFPIVGGEYGFLNSQWFASEPTAEELIDGKVWQERKFFQRGMSEGNRYPILIRHWSRESSLGRIKFPVEMLTFGEPIHWPNPIYYP